MDTAAPPSFLCPIGQEIMRDPVACADGHSYERVNIERWLATNNTSPRTGAQLPNNALIPNHALRNSIEEWLSANFKLVPRSAVHFDGESFIARGSFKTVYRGTLQGRSEPIAVLRMRMGGSCEEEAAKLVKLGRHSALVRYLGICTEGPDQLLLTELAPHGSLNMFLEAHEDAVTLPHKLKVLEQTCAGMIALSGAGMVHRDLAMRNLLVFAFDAIDPAATVIKITDFGLAVDRHYQTHATVQGEDVPFRWMPPEALRRRRFSEKSDVWAFGVTAWELLTGGDMPYAFIGSNEAVAERVCGGERLKRPNGCPDELWALIQRTWAAAPAERPTFMELAGELTRMHQPEPAPVPVVETWESIRAQLTQMGYPPSACLGCTPMEAGFSCFYGAPLFCSICVSHGARPDASDTRALRVLLHGAAPLTGDFDAQAEAVMPQLDAAFGPDAFMPAAALRNMKSAINRNFGSLSPQRLAATFDELEDRGFVSAAQAAELLAVIESHASFDHGAHWRYYHVICHRILDRWNTSDELHGIGDCYHGWSSPDDILRASRTAMGARTAGDIRRYVQEQLFVPGKLRFKGDSYPEQLPGFYAALLRRIDGAQAAVPPPTQAAGGCGQ